MPSSFFQHVDQKRVQTSAGGCDLPILYRDASLLSLSYRRLPGLLRARREPLICARDAICPQRLELLGIHVGSQTKQLRAAANPVARNLLALGIIVVGSEVVGQVARAIINSGSGKHGLTRIAPLRGDLAPRREPNEGKAGSE